MSHLQNQLFRFRTPEDILSDSETRYRTLIEQSPFSIQIFAPDGRCLSANQAWEELWGVSREHLAGYNTLNDPQLESRGVMPIVRRAFAGEAVRLPSVCYDPADNGQPGRKRWVQANLYPVKSAGGELLEVVLLLADVTEHKHSEEEKAHLASQIEAERRRLSDLLETVPGCLWETHGDPLTGEQSYSYVSEYAETLSGYTMEEWRTIPRLWLKILHPDDLAAKVASFNDEAVDGAATVAQARWIRKDGRVIWVETRRIGIFDAGGRRIGHRGITTDITAQKELEESLRVESETRRRHAESTKILQEVIGDLAGALTEEQIAEVAVGRGRGLCGADDAVLVLLRSTTGEAEIIRTAGFGHLIPEQWMRFPLHASPSFASAVESRCPLFVHSLQESAAQFPDLARAGALMGTVSCAVLPLYTEGELQGVLGFGMRARHDFAREDREALMSLARQIAQTLDRARLFRQTRQAERNQRFLSEAGAILSSSLDYSETLAGITRLFVPSMADLCFIDLIDERTGCASRAHFVMAAPQGPSAVEHPLARPPRREAASWHPTSRAAYAGEPTFISDLCAEGVSIADESAMESLISVPLLARGRSLGALSFATTKGRPRLTASDFGLAEELARRAALAVDNSRLYKEAREALRARDNFISIASHELKTPLTSMKIQAQLTARRISRGDLSALEPAAMLKMLEQSDRQLNRLARLVDDMLDLSRIHSGHLNLDRKTVDLTALLVELVDRFRPQLSEAGCPLELRIQSNVTGCWDAHRIEQVVCNLITNAIRYAAGAQVSISLAVEHDKAFIRVRDAGPGIPPENHQKIFDRFERGMSSNAVSGLGLGLYIARQIAEAHGGRLLLESEPGRGAQFTVELPHAH